MADPGFTNRGAQIKDHVYAMHIPSVKHEVHYSRGPGVRAGLRALEALKLYIFFHGI